jgi:hypothetical protein
MKQITSFLFFLVLSFRLVAQPTSITWQGKLLDSGGNTITLKSVFDSMTFFWHTDYTDLTDPACAGRFFLIRDNQSYPCYLCSIIKMVFIIK